MPIYKLLFKEMAALQPRYWREADQNADFLRTIILNSDADILVAADSGDIAGFALVRAEQTPPYACIRPRRFAYLMDICVADERRREGSGSLLIAAVEDWARARGLDYVELTVLEENRQAARLYARHGFADTKRTMHRVLTD
ncbi:MAG: GNAT family N-acetyltransferase [Oscillospiraceae bacterium]|nr:GNAT family N-acetyltransferase [Oscillospiraceae bacterium]